MSKAIDPKECLDLREDYLECLHHKKEVRTSVEESGNLRNNCVLQKLRANMMHREFQRKPKEEQERLMKILESTPDAAK